MMKRFLFCLLVAAVATSRSAAQTIDCTTALDCQECIVGRCGYADGMCFDSCADVVADGSCFASKNYVGLSADEICELAEPGDMGMDMDVDMANATGAPTDGDLDGMNTNVTNSSQAVVEEAMETATAELADSAADDSFLAGLKMIFLGALLVAGLVV